MKSLYLRNGFVNYLIGGRRRGSLFILILLDRYRGENHNCLKIIPLLEIARFLENSNPKFLRIYINGAGNYDETFQSYPSFWTKFPAFLSHFLYSHSSYYFTSPFIAFLLFFRSLVSSIVITKQFFIFGTFMYKSGLLFYVL